MTGVKTNSSRRAFFLRSGAVLGAGVATTAGAAALIPVPTPAVPEQLQRLQQQLGSHDDREAIRQLHLSFAALMEDQAYEDVAELFHESAHLNLSGLAAVGKAAIVNLLAAEYRQQQAAAMHTAYRQNPRQRQDVVTLSNDRRQASATFHAEVQISTPLMADSTAAQMARLQGQVAQRRWESGRFDAQYVKVQGLWKMASLRYSRI